MNSEEILEFFRLKSSPYRCASSSPLEHRNFTSYVHGGTYVPTSHERMSCLPLMETHKHIQPCIHTHTPTPQPMIHSSMWLCSCILHVIAPPVSPPRCELSGVFWAGIFPCSHLRSPDPGAEPGHKPAGCHCPLRRPNLYTPLLSLQLSLLPTWGELLNAGVSVHMHPHVGWGTFTLSVDALWLTHTHT